MRKTLLACAIAPMLLASGAKADPMGTFTSKVNYITINPAQAAGWIAAMPQIADDCGMKVSKAQVFNVAQHFRHGTDIDTFLSAFKDGRAHNELMDSWLALDSSGHDRGCSVADRLWGEDGEMFPGVLHKL